MSPGILLGTTFPLKDAVQTEDIHYGSLSPTQAVSCDGPSVNGEPTVFSLFSPRQLVGSPLLPSLQSVINAAFSLGHSRDAVLPANALRLQREGQYLEELGDAPGTFTYIVHRRDGRTVLATATSKRYSGPFKVVHESQSQHKTFTRITQPDPDIQEWELNLMAVEPSAQSQGLASYLMQLVEKEIRSRCKQAVDRPRNIKLVLTTIKEINEKFYARRGFTMDYETFHGPGYLRSPRGFTVIHMSRSIENEPWDPLEHGQSIEQ